MTDLAFVPLCPLSGAPAPAIGWCYRADINATRDQVSLALIRLKQQLIGLGLDPDALIRMELVLAEVLNNIVEHAFCDTGRGEIALETSVHSNTIWCHLTDGGRPMPGGKPPPARRYDLGEMDMLDLPEGGFGWGLIRDLTSSLAYDRSGAQNRLTFSIDLDY
jgi:serine/threonine-protein kinase RsbW